MGTGRAVKSPRRWRALQNRQAPGLSFLERVAGIEPARSAWEADRLPLHHTRWCRAVDLGSPAKPVNEDEISSFRNVAALRVLLNISTLTISVAYGNTSLRNRRDRPRPAPRVRPPRGRARRHPRAVEGAVRLTPQARPAPGRARRHARRRADHPVPDRRPAARKPAWSSAARSGGPPRVAAPRDRKGAAAGRTSCARSADELIAEAFAGIERRATSRRCARVLAAVRDNVGGRAAVEQGSRTNEQR